MMTTFGVNKTQSQSPFEEYFSSATNYVGARRLASDIATIKSNYGEVWNQLGQEEQEQLIDESIIKPEAVLRYEHDTQKPLPFGAGQVYPRLKHPTGQKTNLIDDTSGSQGEDLDSASSSGICTFTYQDEHSAPFSWRTRSQQDLTFEFGRPPSMTSDDLNENNLEQISASPSKILSSRNSRQSRGNPSFAKPVQIPVVPRIPKPEKGPDIQNGHYSHVPPEQINNFVYESSPNRIVLDFGHHDTNGQSDVDITSDRTDSPAAESTKSTTSLISRVRTLTRKAKKLSSSSSSSNGEERERKSSTLDLRRRRKSQEQQQQQQQRHSSASNNMENHANNKKIVVVKPSVAPPPPPPSIITTTTRTTSAPPPPPIRTVSQISKKSDFVEEIKPKVDIAPANEEENNKSNAKSKEKEEDSSDQEVKTNRDSGELDNFTIDLTTESKEIPKTGFDFLDDW